MGRWTLAALVAVVLSVGGDAPVARASQRAAVVDELSDLRKACRQGEAPGRRRLYVIRVPEVRFGAYRKDERFLPLDGRRNLRALDGAVELFPAGLEPVGFEVDAERAAALRRLADGGAHLRVGFFLGFDNRHGTVCVLRSAFGVTTVRMDLAFVEMLDREGELLARHTTDRLRAWMDDLARDRIPGRGPRAALRGVTASSGAVLPESWRRAVDGTDTAALGRCHAQAVAEGGSGTGRVVVRAEVEPSSGRVRETGVELSTVTHPEAECIARALGRGLELPPAPEAGRDPIQLSLVVQLAD